MTWLRKRKILEEIYITKIWLIYYTGTKKDRKVGTLSVETCSSDFYWVNYLTNEHRATN